MTVISFGDCRLPDRFWSKVSPCPMTGCWLFVSSQDAIGYGRIGWRGRVLKAHRVAYEVLVGPVAEGLELDHLCRVRCCVNPAHLEQVTREENMRRSRAHITHCPSGHSYSGANLILYEGRRYCRECNRRCTRLGQRRRRQQSKVVSA